jgi:putative toxin-antitoxin system antitoxin component (TIGR02293 family)
LHDLYDRKAAWPTPGQPRRLYFFMVMKRGNRPGKTGVVRHGRTFGAELTQKLSNAGGGISVAQVRKGLPMKALLQRKVGDNDRLGSAASDRLARVQRILQLAEHVLGDTTKAARWLTTPSRILHDTPLRMLDTDIGSQRVQQELHQIEFGMPA